MVLSVSVLVFLKFGICKSHNGSIITFQGNFIFVKIAKFMKIKLSPIISLCENCPFYNKILQ